VPFYIISPFTFWMNILIRDSFMFSDDPIIDLLSCICFKIVLCLYTHGWVV
jgi:hypothetical protein